MKKISTPALLIIITSVAFTAGYFFSEKKFQEAQQANLDALSVIAVYTGSQVALADHSLSRLRDGNHAALAADLELVIDDAVVYLENLRDQMIEEDMLKYIDGVHLAALDYRLDHPWKDSTYEIPLPGSIPIIQHATDLARVKDAYQAVADRNRFLDTD